MNTNELINSWEKDCKIDKTKLDEESGNIPVLHSKYQSLLLKESQKYKLLNIKKRNLKIKLEDYYNGKDNGESLGREPWQYNESKTSIEKKIENDRDINNIEIAMIELEEKIKFLQGIITNINQRNWQIKNIIEFWRWTNGSL